MRNVKLSKHWDSLRSSYWFLPGILALSGMALAFIMLTLDRSEQLQIQEVHWIYTGGPDGARGLLSAVAGSMVTVAATAFSITIVALQLASSNFGPRLLRNFMQDTGNQIVLGTFIATFLYCLLVLRTVRGEDYNFFVPQLSVTVGIVLTIASIGVLIYFIHHASTIIQASHVIESVATDLDQAIERLYPDRVGQSLPEPPQKMGKLPQNFAAEACSVQANHTGYLQAIDDETLMKIACKYDLLLQLNVRPGAFVIKGSNLATVYPGERVNRMLCQQINTTFLLGRERTEQQDVSFPLNQLVEIALRAISPAINDPFTAIRCIDRLSAGLSYLAQREFPSPYRYDKAHHLRIIAEPTTFEDLVDDAFNEIRSYGRSDTAVSLRLLDAIARIATYTNNSNYRLILQHHANLVEQSCREGLSQEEDYKRLKKRYQEVTKMLLPQPNTV
jgi:uncharacterized membrane protein